MDSSWSFWGTFVQRAYIEERKCRLEWFSLRLSSGYRQQLFNMAGTTHSDPEKTSPLHIDDISTSEKDFKAQDTLDGADYSGAVAKTDPAEIALVRKLDMRVMPALFCMYFLYARSSIQLLESHVHISDRLQEQTRSECHCQRQTKQP